MGAAPESKFVPISQMGPWTFWTRIHAIDVTPEEESALLLGVISPERRAEIDARVAACESALRRAIVPGVQAWMSPKRMVS